VAPATLAACLAALPQLVVYARHVRSGDYPGSAYPPRVTTMLRMSASAAEGGPFASVREGDRFRLAANVVPDLGVPALLDAAARLRGRPATEAALGTINLAFLAAALFALVFATPLDLRWALVPVFLALPLSVVEYRSVDTVAIHGALAALAIAGALWSGRPGAAWTAAASGVVLFVVAKVRSAYGLYALAALVLVACVLALRGRPRQSLARAGVALVVLAVLELAWLPLVRARASDPRVADRGILTSHDVYAMLISGVGWSPNRWGIEAPDPRVVMFISRRLSLSELPRLDTEEGERDARRAYLSLWREDPWHLAVLYARRAIGGIGDHLVFGRWGAPLWAAVVGWATLRAWRRRDTDGLTVLAAALAVTACLVAQVAVVDPRTIYAYPLRFVSGLTLAYAAAVLILGRTRTAEPAQGALNSSRG
jgi:hypothetical protein